MKLISLEVRNYTIFFFYHLHPGWVSLCPPHRQALLLFGFKCWLILLCPQPSFLVQYLKTRVDNSLFQLDFSLFLNSYLILFLNPPHTLSYAPAFPLVTRHHPKDVSQSSDFRCVHASVMNKETFSTLTSCQLTDSVHLDAELLQCYLSSLSYHFLNF